MNVRMFQWTPADAGVIGSIVSLDITSPGFVVLSSDGVCGFCASFPGSQDEHVIISFAVRQIVVSRWKNFLLAIFCRVVIREWLRAMFHEAIVCSLW